jgi:ribosomal protein S12 methylthiotransferase accessory factor
MLKLLLDDLRLEGHRFLPDPHCPDCGYLPDDSPEAAAIVIRPALKLSERSYRTRSLTENKARLLELYSDAETGMVTNITKDPNNLYAAVSARIGLPDRAERGFGRGLDFEESLVAAIAEALERFGGVRPGGKRTRVRSSFNELGNRALDPTTLGLPSEAQYARPTCPYLRYHHDLVFNWVWGYSFRRREPMLVPELHAYYRFDRDASDRPFAFEISNGCAIGCCLEEAILHGLLEIAERDAFLMTWYAGLPVPRIDLRSVQDPSIALMVERLEHMTGYTVHAFDTTMEQRIPSFWVMAVDEENRSGTAKMVCAAGSSLDPERGLASALQEVAPLAWWIPARYQDERPRALRMLEDDDLVVRMEDHSLLYSLPEAWHRLSFLYETTEQLSLAEAFRDTCEQVESQDLAVDLDRVINRYLATALDVIVVDQTTPEHELGGFRCVKVLVPGTLAMTFGNHARRTDGIERLRTVPVRLGYRSAPLTEADLNLRPHPFP